MFAFYFLSSQVSSITNKANLSRITNKGIINVVCHCHCQASVACASEAIIAHRSHRPAQCIINNVQRALRGTTGWSAGHISVMCWTQLGKNGSRRDPDPSLDVQQPVAGGLLLGEPIPNITPRQDVRHCRVAVKQQ